MENQLDLAHLSWCSGLDSQSAHMIYMQILPVMILRYGTYVDAAAPIFSWTFFQETVLQTLEEAQTGTAALLCFTLYRPSNLAAVLHS